jgi:hypothetical protein
VVPGEDSRNKQLREIDQLLAGAPLAVHAPQVGQASACLGLDGDGNAANSASISADSSGALNSNVAARDFDRKADRLKPVLLEPSVPVDLLFDNHVVELEECRRWANSDAGQMARIENPAGFANVKAHAEAHLRAVGLAYAAQGATGKNGVNGGTPAAA